MQTLWIRLTRTWLSGSALALALAAPATAGPIALNTFYQFAFTDAGTPATGCDPADPAGPFCIPSSGTPTTFLSAPPWTFVAPVGGAFLTVLDAFNIGDRFQVFDFGTSLGLTSVPIGFGDCGDDPLACLADPNSSKRVFTLAPGAHSITLTPTLSDGGGSGYLRVTQAIPEPALPALLLAGAACLLGLRRRSARAARG